MEQLNLDGPQDRVTFCPFCGHNMAEQKDRSRCEMCYKEIKVGNEAAP